jgi:methylated-DNA-[protein]-cysteine S-methyltransferase
MARMNELERTLHEAAAKLPAGPSGGVGHGLARAAADARVLDLAYAWVDSPFGRLLVASTPRGLVHVSFPEAPTDAVLERLAKRLSPRILEAPEQLDDVRRELDEYFEGRRRRFDISLDWSLTRGFHRSVLRSTARIGYGHVKSYSEVAARAGSPRAVRATGNALGANPIPVIVPCHRVVRTGGALGGYGGGLDRKEYLLRLEGALPG